MTGAGRIKTTGNVAVAYENVLMRAGTALSCAGNNITEDPFERNDCAFMEKRSAGKQLLTSSICRGPTPPT